MEQEGIITYKKILKDKERSKDPRMIIYLLAFLFTLHLTPASYINSSFLEQFTGKNFVGLVYTVGSFLTILVFMMIRRVLNKCGNFKTFIAFLTTNALSLGFMSLSLIITPNYLWGRAFIIAYIIGEISRNVAFLNLDIFLEHISENKDTGGIRGFFLTALNIAFVLGPIIAGLLIKNTFDSGVVYLWGFVISLFVILLSIKHFKNFKDTKYTQTHLWQSLKEVKQKPNLNRIFMSSFILQFFFSWMIIYTPIFLHNYIGFTLSEIAIIIGIALVPFVILEIPLGKIADEKFGEKEILTIGFIITAFFTVIMAFVNIKSFWLWVAILFMTRVGASMIEIMTETYLFKKVDAENINIMGLFRAIRPASYVVSPILASIILLYFSINYLFVILGLVLITGIGYSLRLDDTK